MFFHCQYLILFMNLSINNNFNIEPIARPYAWAPPHRQLPTQLHCSELCVGATVNMSYIHYYQLVLLGGWNRTDENRFWNRNALKVLKPEPEPKPLF